MKNDVGMSWKMVRLDDFCRMNSGGTPSRSNLSFYNGEIPWAKISDIENAEGGVIQYTEEHITAEGLASINNRIFEKGTLLLAMYGSVGKVAFAGMEMTTNQAILGIKIKDESKISYAYLKYWFQTIKEQLLNRAVGGTLQNISLGIVKELQIPLPPLTIQKRIAEILDAADALKRKDQALLKKYDELAQAIFIDMFGDPVKNEKGWEVIEFGNCIDYIGDIGSNGSNATISKNIEMLDTEDYAIMIRTTNLNANNFEKNLKYVSEKTYNFFSKSKILGGEIIMNKIGSAGDFWIMPFLNRPVSLGLNQLVIRLKNLNTKYLYYYLSTNYGKAMIKASINGAVTKSITKTAVKALPLLYPNIDLQNKFSKIISLIENQKNQSTTINSNQLFNSLIQKAFKGELVK